MNDLARAAPHLARLPFSERAIKLGADGRPLEAGSDERHVAVYDPLMDLTHPRADLAAGQVKHKRALDLASEFRLFDLSGWRLMTSRFEFMSIIEPGRYDPAVDTSLLDVKSGWYWTDEVYEPVAANRWCVHLYDGGTSALHRSDTAFARAVRSGQPSAFGVGRAAA